MNIQPAGTPQFNEPGREVHQRASAERPLYEPDSFSKGMGGTDAPKLMRNLSGKAVADALLKGLDTGFDKKWEFDLGDPGASCHFDPVPVEGGVVFSFNGCTRKFDEGGKELWKAKTDVNGRSLPAVDQEGNIYVLGQGNLISLDKNGSERWRAAAGERNWERTPVLGRDGNVYVIDDDHRLSCFDPKGKKRWEIKEDTITWKKPVIDTNGNVHAGGSGEEGFTCAHYVVRPPAGRLQKPRLKEVPVGQHDVLHQVTVDGKGNIYGFRDGSFRVSGPDGKELWSCDLPGDTTSIHQQIGPDGNIYVSVRNHSIICLAPDGKKNWQFSTDQNKEPLSSNMAWGKDGTVYVTGYGGNWKLYSISPDGKAKWTGEANCHLSAPKAGPDGNIYTGYEVTGLKAFSPETGKKIMDMPVRMGFAENYHFTGDGDLLLVDDKGLLMKGHFTTKEESLDKIREDATKGEDPAAGQDSIETGDGWVDIGGVRLDVKNG